MRNEEKSWGNVIFMTPRFATFSTFLIFAVPTSIACPGLAETFEALAHTCPMSVV
jgi:hypothetical protein